MDFTVPKIGLTSLERWKISVLFSLVHLFPTEILLSDFLLIFFSFFSTHLLAMSCWHMICWKSKLVDTSVLFFPPIVALFLHRGFYKVN